MYMYTINFNPCVLNKDSHTYLTNLKYNDFLNSILYCKLQYIYLICLISCTALKDHLYTTKVLTYKADIGFCLYKKHIVLYYMRNRLFTIEKQLKSNFFFTLISLVSTDVLRYVVLYVGGLCNICDFFSKRMYVYQY